MLWCVISHSSVAQEGQEQEVNPKRLRTFVIGSSVLYGATLVGLNELWYKDFPRRSFHFFNDNSQWLQVDKVGHFYSAFHLSSAGTKAFQWTGLNDAKSHFWGSMLGVIFLTPIEIMDGFSSEFGASYGDLIANTAGSGLFLGQYLVWKEVRIHPKFSFQRTDFAPLRPTTLGDGFQEEILKDYNGQTYWLSVDIYKFLPSESKFPKWLNIAFGYGGENMIFANRESNLGAGFDPFRQYYIGLDWDLTHIKSRSKVINTLLFAANMIRLPAPALELSRERVKFHILSF
ncbi:MAG: DUF2279 domain-containing protein [Bacteroidota bacterium]